MKNEGIPVCARKMSALWEMFAHSCSQRQRQTAGRLRFFQLSVVSRSGRISSVVILSRDSGFESVLYHNIELVVSVCANSVR